MCPNDPALTQYVVNAVTGHAEVTPLIEGDSGVVGSTVNAVPYAPVIGLRLQYRQP